MGSDGIEKKHWCGGGVESKKIAVERNRLKRGSGGLYIDYSESRWYVSLVCMNWVFPERLLRLPAS
jgi:hypothetical protein